MSFTTEWMLSEINQQWETRSKPANPAEMEYREHRTVSRYKVTDETWVEATGGTNAGNVDYYVGSISRGAGPVSGGLWVCTNSAAQEMGQGRDWRKIVETWECWSNWSDMPNGVIPE